MTQILINFRKIDDIVLPLSIPPRKYTICPLPPRKFYNRIYYISNLIIDFFLGLLLHEWSKPIGLWLFVGKYFDGTMLNALEYHQTVIL